MYSIIYSSDYDFQVIQFLPYKDSSQAWDIANKLYSDGELEKLGIGHYDVVSFNSLDELNNYILRQSGTGRTRIGES